MTSKGKQPTTNPKVLSKLINALAALGVLPGDGEHLVVRTKHDPECEAAQSPHLRPCKCTRHGIELRLIAPDMSLVAAVRNDAVDRRADPELVNLRAEAEARARLAAEAGPV